MAVCEIWDVRGRLDHPIDYAENPEKTANPKYTEADLQAMVDVMEYATNKNKTEQRFFVTGVNCDPNTARDEMMIPIHRGCFKSVFPIGWFFLTVLVKFPFVTVPGINFFHVILLKNAYKNNSQWLQIKHIQKLRILIKYH